jgi:ribonuclease P protein component
LAGDPASWGRLLRRAEYQRVSRGKRVNAAGFTLQAARSPEGETEQGPRYGLTVTKKTGNSPQRHRIKRRLREAMRLVSPLDARPDHDYVLMARRDALTLAFDALVADIAGAIQRAHAARRLRDERT